MKQYLLIVLVLVSQSRAFNVDVYEPIVRESLQNDDFYDSVNKDMFGYRVALYNRTDGPRFIVGAPRGSVVGVPRPPAGAGVYNFPYGVVYSCPVDQGVCVGFNDTGGILYDNTNNPSLQQKNGQLLGATIKVRDRGILVCAPRHITIIGQDLHTFGRCYRSYDTGVSPTFVPLVSSVLGANICESFALAGTTSIDHITSSVCTAGISGEIRGNLDPVRDGTDESASITLGIPGQANWQGAFVVSSPPRPFGVYYLYTDDDVNVFERSSAMFGYDVVYYRGSNSETDPRTAISAPRAKFLRGFIRCFITANRVVVESVQTIFGPKVGIGFGASLAAADFNGDGIDELIVGAPRYSEDDNVDIGQIFIYTSFAGQFMLSRMISGIVPNAQFGYALIGLGDIDRNGLEDLAVGAPFGTGSGSVYIFSGVGGSEMLRETQVIIGNELSDLQLPEPSSFGFSFSNALDVDGNDYPDFAVGSYLSQRVYLFRSRPVANMTLSFNLSADFLDLNASQCMLNSMMYFCIDISACFNYSGLNVGNTLDINYQFVIERRNQEDNSRFSRGLFLNNASIINGRRTVTREVTSCVHDTIHFKSNAADQFTPLSVEFDMFLDPVTPVNTNGNTPLSSLRSGPVLRVVGSNTVRIPLIRNCGPDARCIPNLMISAGPGMVQYEVNGVVDDTIESISTGVVTAVLIPIRLINSGNESALGPIVTFDLLQGTRFIRAFVRETDLAQICTETNVDNMTRVECNMGFSLPPSEGRNYIFRIQTREIIGSEGNFSITFTANNSLNEDTEPMDNSYTVSFTVTAEADVFIQSSFRPDSVQIGRTEADMDMTITEVSDLGPAIEGQFVVRNAGPSLIPTLRLDIFWPSMTESENEFLLYPSRILRDSNEVSCSEDVIDPSNFNNNTRSRRKRQSSDNQVINCADQRAACVTITCMVSNLRANESATVRIEGFVDDATFMGTTSLWTFTAFSRVTILTDYITEPLDELPNDDTANLMGIPPNLSTDSSDDGVEAWVIIVPIVVAIIIIVVATILLYFFGFFKRKKVEEDEADLANWQSPNNGEDDTIPQNKGTPASEDPST